MINILIKFFIYKQFLFKKIYIVKKILKLIYIQN